MSISECARLQGFCYHKLKWPIKFSSRHALLGNTVSVNVLQRIMVRIFTSLGHHISDPWTNQTALKSVQHDAKSDIIHSRSLITQYFRIRNQPLAAVNISSPTTTITITAQAPAGLVNAATANTESIMASRFSLMPSVGTSLLPRPLDSEATHPETAAHGIIGSTQHPTTKPIRRNAKSDIAHSRDLITRYLRKPLQPQPAIDDGTALVTPTPTKAVAAGDAVTVFATATRSGSLPSDGTWQMMTPDDPEAPPFETAIFVQKYDPTIGFTQHSAPTSLQLDAKSDMAHKRSLTTQFFKQTNRSRTTDDASAPSTAATVVTCATLRPSPPQRSSSPPSPFLPFPGSSLSTVHPPVHYCPSSDESEHAQVTSLYLLKDNQQEEIPFHIFECKDDIILATPKHSPITWKTVPDTRDNPNFPWDSLLEPSTRTPARNSAKALWVSKLEPSTKTPAKDELTVICPGARR